MNNPACLHRVVCLLALVAALDVPFAAAATPEEKRVAREHFERGQVHFDLKEYDKALEAFKEAYRVIQDPAFLFNIAQCHTNLGQHEEALGFYRNYLRRADRAPNRPEVEARIVELEGILSRKHAEEEAATKPPQPGQAAPSTPAQASSSPIAEMHESVTPAPGASAVVPPPASSVAVDPGRAPAVERASVEPAASPPLYRRWWFWTGIGAAVAAGVVTAVVIGRRGEVGDCMGLSPCHRVGGP